MMRLAMAESGNFGWGVCVTNLRKAFRELPEFEGSEKVVIHAITGPTFEPVRPTVRGDINIGYIFFEEDETVKRYIATAKHLYDAVAVGSRWGCRILEDLGAPEPRAILQGVDHDMFPYSPRLDDGKFVVFSGGKWEYRKGQDLVVLAMREFMQRHSDVYLQTAWHNPWSSSLNSMKKWAPDVSPHSSIMEQQGFPKWYEAMLDMNGLPADRVSDCRHRLQREMVSFYEATDIGLFPNRCEGGTNLVMMEYLATGRPVIATDATGHRDITRGLGHSWFPLRGKTRPIYDSIGEHKIANWFFTCQSAILDSLEIAYKHRTLLPNMGKHCNRHMQQFTWEKTAQGFASLAKYLLRK